MKTVTVNIHIFSRHLGVRLPGHKHLIFNLLSKNGQIIFQIAKTDSLVVKRFCDHHGTDFKVNSNFELKISDDLTLIFK